MCWVKSGGMKNKMNGNGIQVSLLFTCESQFDTFLKIQSKETSLYVTFVMCVSIPVVFPALMSGCAMSIKER